MLTFGMDTVDKSAFDMDVLVGLMPRCIDIAFVWVGTLGARKAGFRICRGAVAVEDDPVVGYVFSLSGGEQIEYYNSISKT